MKNLTLFLMLQLTAGALSALRAAGPADEFKLPAEEVRLKPGDGVDLVKGNCLLCHSSDYISTQPRLTRAQWTAAVDKMRLKYGAPLRTNDQPAVVGYLTGQYGK